MIKGLNYHQAVKRLYYLYFVNSSFHDLAYVKPVIIEHMNLNCKHRHLMVYIYLLYHSISLL